MKKLSIGLFFVLFVILVLGYLYVRRLSATSPVTNVPAQLQNSALFAARRGKTQFYEYFVFPLTVRTTEDSSNGITLSGDATVNQKQYLVKVNLPAKNQQVSVHTFSRDVSGNLINEKFQFMSAGDALAMMSNSKGYLYVSIGLQTFNKPQNCNEQCELFYRTIEAYKQKNLAFVDDPQQKENTVGAIVELAIEL